MGQHRSWGVVAAVVMSAMALVVSLSGTALGGVPDLFSDIATSPFRTEINRIGRAGCASGFPDGTFHPRDAVNRQQFAFWTNNCGGRTGSDFDATTVPNNASNQVLTELALTAGATDQGGNATPRFVLVWGNVVVSTTTLAGCPCRLTASILNPEGNVSSTPAQTTLHGPLDHSLSVATTLPVMGLFTIQPGATEHFQLRMSNPDPDGPTMSVSGDIAAIYVPFGADGDSAFDAG
jgi:S-layer homology domain